MVLTGRTHGEYAEKYPEFCYSKALPEPVDAFPPVFQGPEYTCAPVVKVVRLLDYSFDIQPVRGLPEGYDATKMSLYLEPNRYTRAVVRKRMLQIVVSDFNAKTPGEDAYIDMMLRTVFDFKK